MDQVISVASSLLAAIVGGGLALWGSHSVLSRSFKLEREKSEVIEKQRRANGALTAFFKLLDTSNCAGNYKRQIDEMFAEAAGTPSETLEVWSKIRPLVGKVEEVVLVEVEEVTFLIEMKRSDLLNRIRLSQTRIANIVSNIELYSEMRSDFLNQVQDASTEATKTDVLAMQASVSGPRSAFFEMREDQINNLIGQIIEHLEHDESEARIVTAEFLSASREFFGEYIPDFTLGFTDDA